MRRDRLREPADERHAFGAAGDEAQHESRDVRRALAPQARRFGVALGMGEHERRQPPEIGRSGAPDPFDGCVLVAAEPGERFLGQGAVRRGPASPSNAMPDMASAAASGSIGWAASGIEGRRWRPRRMLSGVRVKRVFGPLANGRSQLGIGTAVGLLSGAGGTGSSTGSADRRCRSIASGVRPTRTSPVARLAAGLTSSEAGGRPVKRMTRNPSRSGLDAALSRRSIRNGQR